MLSQNQMERMLEREKCRKLAAIIIEIKEVEKLEEFNELAKCLNIKLIKESKKTKKTIFSIAEYISNGKNLKIKSIDSSFKDKCIAYCPELLSGILSPCSYVNIKAMNIISSDTKITKKSVFYSRKMILPSFLKYVCQLIKE